MDEGMTKERVHSRVGLLLHHELSLSVLVCHERSLIFPHWEMTNAYIRLFSKIQNYD